MRGQAGDGRPRPGRGGPRCSADRRSGLRVVGDRRRVWRLAVRPVRRRMSWIYSSRSTRVISGAVLARIEEDGVGHAVDGVARSASSKTRWGFAAELEVRRFEVLGGGGHLEPARIDPVIGPCWDRGLDQRLAGRPRRRKPRCTPRAGGPAAPSRPAPESIRAWCPRLDHQRVARGHRRADLPEGHHQRVVPRRDLGDHTLRLAAHGGGEALDVVPGGSPSAPGRTGKEPQLVGPDLDLLGVRSGS